LLFLLALGMFWDQHRQLNMDKIEAEEVAASLRHENARLRARLNELEQTLEQQNAALARTGQAREASP
jgi:hypothetical protein